ncbi:MAG: hypothetical protein ABL997_03590 [Planctomycetota bacterium]
MTHRAPKVLRLLLPLLFAAAVRGQDWTDEQLIEASKAFQSESLPERLAQIGVLLPEQQKARTAMVARIHGDHREYMLKIERLMTELTDARWAVREQAERSLIEVGARAKVTLQQRAEQAELVEERMRCRRVLDAILARGTADEERQLRLLRGLVSTSLYMTADERMLRSLRSALGHTDSSIVEAAIRALGVHGHDDDADAVSQLLDWKGGVHRNSVLNALYRMRTPRALALCTQMLQEGKLSRSEQCALLLACRERDDATGLITQLASSSDVLVASAAKLHLPPKADLVSKVSLTLSNRTAIEGMFEGIGGDHTLLRGAVAGLPIAQIAFGDADILDFPEHPLQPSADVRVFLTQGSLVTGKLASIDATTVRLQSPTFGLLELARTGIQGIAIDPTLDRLVGASVEHDRVRLRSNEIVDGTVERLDGDSLSIALAGGGKRVIPLAEVAGLLTVRPQSPEPDTTSYVRADLTNGDRILGFLVGSTSSHLAFTAPMLGAAVVPVTALTHLELGVGGGAMWGFTVIADYSDNRIFEVDDQGREVFKIDDVFGAWDVECLDNSNLLITEFSVSRVQEVNRKGEVVWVYDELKNPYDADRLENGNTLIADTFSLRVIEVNPAKEIVWEYGKEIRPFDVDRLQNGNTLIADVLKDRVIEVTPQGEIVWEVKGMNNTHDADRLPNGNTLITLRSKGSVLEVDREGKVVWELEALNSPSDADRLPNGHTIVSENGVVREFDRRKNVVWRREVNWAVEANRY